MLSLWLLHCFSFQTIDGCAWPCLQLPHFLIASLTSDSDYIFNPHPPEFFLGRDSSFLSSFLFVQSAPRSIHPLFPSNTQRSATTACILPPLSYLETNASSSSLDSLHPPSHSTSNCNGCLFKFRVFFLSGDYCPVRQVTERRVNPRVNPTRRWACRSLLTAKPIHLPLKPP